MRQRLDELLADLGVGGGALLLRGDPGIGKTTLLDYAESISAVRYPVHRVAGVETETMMPFAALGELLVPLRRHFAGLPGLQRTNLEAAVALSNLASAPVVNPYAVCVAVLNVLSQASQLQPLVVVVDDLQWVDPDSDQVLRFLARRIGAERVVFLAASREASGTSGGLPALDVAGLPPRECQRVLELRGLPVAPRVLSSLVAFSRGNPLILLEYASRLTLAQRLGERPLPASPIVGDRAEQGWIARLRALPRPTQHALALVAAAREANLALLDPALTASGLSLRDLIPAEEARLLTSDEHSYDFVHPILRTLALNGVSAPTRREIYKALANQSTGALRAWYLASAVFGPDEAVAQELGQAAAEARQCGSYLTAAQAWHRAADLTPQPELGAARLLQAATDAFTGGACHDAADWCETAQGIATGAVLRADLALLRGRALTWMGRVGQAHRLLTAAAEEIAATDPFRAYQLASEAVLPATMRLDLPAGIRAARRCQQFRPPTEIASASGPLSSALAHLLIGDVPDARVELRQAMAVLDDADPVEAAMELGLLAQLCNFVEYYDDAQP